MAFATCAQCHHPLTPGDDVCSHCGAFISTLTYPQGKVVPILPYGMPISQNRSATTGTPIRQSTPSASICPGCKAPVQPGEDICERCGAILGPEGTSPLAQPIAPVQPSEARPPGPAEEKDTCPRCQAELRPGKKFCSQCGATIPLILGDVLGGKYLLQKKIGSGGMGAVFLAEDQVLHRKVVVKALLNNEDPTLVEQSIKEREFLARLNHGNIVSIYDCIAQGNDGYIIMEYVHGKTLDQLLEERQTPFDVTTAINYILGILPAFAYLAKLDMVYCDFKPQNVMLEMREDGVQTVKLIDLGTVIKYGPKPERVFGTHGFYAREAIKTPSPQTDLYSICRTLAYLVTVMEMSRPLFGMPPAQEYPEFQHYPALYRLLVKGTHDDPTRRFQSAEELEEQLRGVLLLCTGGGAGVQFESRKFVATALTNTGRLGRRGETILDGQDRAIQHLSYGDQALQNGNYAGALNFYQQALKANPQSIDAYARLVDTYLEQEQVKEAELLFSRVPQQTTNHWKTRWSNARLYEMREQWAEAAQLYLDLMLDLPGELTPLQALARVYTQQGHLKEAIQLYEYVLRADPGNVDTLFAIAHCLLKEQRWDDAIRYINNVSEAAARYIDAQVLLCDIYVHRATPALPSSLDIEKATGIISKLKGRIADGRYYLWRGEIYYLAWLLARQGLLPAHIVLADAARPTPRELGRIAESSYKQFLRSEQELAPREEVIRRKFAVSSWRF